MKTGGKQPLIITAEKYLSCSQGLRGNIIKDAPASLLLKNPSWDAGASRLCVPTKIVGTRGVKTGGKQPLIITVEKYRRKVSFIRVEPPEG